GADGAPRPPALRAGGYAEGPDREAESPVGTGPAGFSPRPEAPGGQRRFAQAVPAQFDGAEGGGRQPRRRPAQAERVAGLARRHGFAPQPTGQAGRGAISQGLSESSAYLHPGA